MRERGRVVSRRGALSSTLLLSGLAMLGQSCVTYGHHGPRSDHFDGERFHNRQPTRDLSFEEGMEWLFTREPGPWRDWVDETPGPRPPSRLGGGHLRLAAR